MKAIDRSAHQPQAEPREHGEPTAQELQAACGHVTALVLACDIDTTPLRVPGDTSQDEPQVCCADELTPRPLQIYQDVPVVELAVKLAVESGLQGVAVLAGGDDELFARISDAACKSCPQVSMMRYDRDDDYRVTLESCGFEAYGLTRYVLDRALECLQCNPTVDAVMVMSCDQVKLQPRHVAQVCGSICDELDVSASWITWLRRTPIAFSRRFLEELDGSSLVQPCNNGGKHRPLPALTMRDQVFGEELLAANDVVPGNVEQFLEQRTLTAREAIQAARAELEGERRLDHAANQADELMLDMARSVVERMRRQMTAARVDELHKADKWAQANAQRFPMLGDAANAGKLAYLDSAATTQRVDAALRAQARFDRHTNANVYRGGYSLATGATAMFNDARNALEKHIGSQRRQTIYTANTSASLNLVAQAWGQHNVGEGDLIVTTIAEHHSNMLPWCMLAQRVGARVEYVPLLPSGELDLHAYELLLQQNPKLVCMAYVGNVLGLVNPVGQMARMAHEVGARVVVDAAQSIAHMPLDVQELEADFVAFSAHKMYGPMGIGGLWVSSQAFDEMDPVSGGGGVVSHVSTDSYYLRVGAIQYEVGTPPISQAVGWSAAIKYLDKLGMEDVRRHGQLMVDYALQGLGDIENLTVWGDHSGESGGLLSFSLAGIAPAVMGSFCGKLGVAIRSGGHCALPLAASMGMLGTARLSVAVHTTTEDIEACVLAVELARKLYWQR